MKERYATDPEYRRKKLQRSLKWFKEKYIKDSECKKKISQRNLLYKRDKNYILNLYKIETALKNVILSYQ